MKKHTAILFITVVLYGFSLFAFSLVAQAQVSSNFGGAQGGAVIIGESSTACDSSVPGALRYNSSTSCVEYCDGSAWICPSSGGVAAEKISVSGGESHTCAVKADGTVWCWGLNSNGQLGNNTTEQKNAPVQVLGVGGSGYLTNVAAVSTGTFHTCALKSDRTVWCWGSNLVGYLERIQFNPDHTLRLRSSFGIPRV